MVINFNNLGGGGNGGGAGIVVDGDSVIINGVPVATATILSRWMVADDPEQLDYTAFREGPIEGMSNTFLKFKYRGYNIGETIETPAYISFLNGMLMYNSYVRLINNSNDTVEICLFAWGNYLYYNNSGSGDLEDLGTSLSINLGESATITGANGVQFSIEYYTDDSSADTDTYQLCKWRINAITGGTVRVDDRQDNEMFQALLCKTPGEPDAPDLIKYNGRKSVFVHV